MKRKAARNGLEANFYSNQYSAAKREKRNARDDWVRTAGAASSSGVASEPPQEILRDWPKLHPRTNFEKARASGQRTYKKQKNTDADSTMKLGESAIE